MRQQDLAAELGLNPNSSSMISKWENGLALPTEQHIHVYIALAEQESGDLEGLWVSAKRAQHDRLTQPATEQSGGLHFSDGADGTWTTTHYTVHATVWDEAIGVAEHRRIRLERDGIGGLHVRRFWIAPEFGQPDHYTHLRERDVDVADRIRIARGLETTTVRFPAPQGTSATFTFSLSAKNARPLPELLMQPGEKIEEFTLVVNWQITPPTEVFRVDGALFQEIWDFRHNNLSTAFKPIFADNAIPTIERFRDSARGLHQGKIYGIAWR